MQMPDYTGGSLINLTATLEQQLVGSTPGIPLRDDLIPPAQSYLVILFDGLGDEQLSHADAAALTESRVGAVDTMFPATTTTVLASLATGLTPAQHGLLGYEMWLPEANHTVNTIHWKPVGGGPELEMDFDGFLPAPNLWERLAAGGAEPVTVQPSNFAGTPLSRVLYRGCRYEPVDTYEEWVEAAASLVAEPGRLVFAYFGAIDVSAHLKGQTSDEYAGALRLASALWARLVAAMPPDAALIGTADHGHVDVVENIRVEAEDDQVYGDGRVLLARADLSELAAGLPAQWVDAATVADWFGPGPRHPQFEARAPAGALVADAGIRLLHEHSDPRLIGVHGALTAQEVRVPLLLG